MKKPHSLKKPNIVIIGGGFGGLYAARALKRAPVEITLLDRGNHHLFQPLLYQVATAGLSAPQIAAPIRKILGSQSNAKVLMAEVTRIQPDARRVVCADGKTLTYDYLIVAAGVKHSYFGNHGWEAHAPGLKTLDDAFEIRSRVLVAFEAAERETEPTRRTAQLTFVVVGGGPTGVELAGALGELSRHTLKREFRNIDPEWARVVLVEGSDRVLRSFSEGSSAKAAAQLDKLGVTLRLNQRVTNINAQGVTLCNEDGEDETIAARTVLWAAGVEASPLSAQLRSGTDRAGRVKVDATLALPANPEIFVIGDMAHVPLGDGLVPGVAPAAIQMGTHAARSIRRLMAGKKAEAFGYVDKGALATIGRSAAVAEVAGRHFSGLMAWLVWVVIHILYLAGFRNRFVVMLDWLWSYMSYNRSARIVLTEAAARGGYEGVSRPKAHDKP